MLKKDREGAMEANLSLLYINNAIGCLSTRYYRLCARLPYILFVARRVWYVVKL